MTDDPALEGLKTLVRAVEGVSDLQGDFLEALKAMRERLEGLEARELERGELTARLLETASLLCNMKAATLVVTCVRCGTRFAKEPGPELCGRCWVEAGRPGTTELRLISTTPRHEGSDTE